MGTDLQQGEVTAVLARLAALIQTSAPARAALPGTLRIVLRDQPALSWLFDPDSTVVLSSSNARAACTLELNAGDLVEIFNGRLNMQRAWLEGRIDVQGNAEILLAYTAFLATQGVLR